MGASLSKNARIDEKLAYAREGGYTFRVRGTICHRICTLLPVESRIRIFAQMYDFDSDMGEQINMRYYVMDGLDRDIVTTLQRV